MNYDDEENILNTINNNTIRSQQNSYKFELLLDHLGLETAEIQRTNSNNLRI